MIKSWAITKNIFKCSNRPCQYRISIFFHQILTEDFQLYIKKKTRSIGRLSLCFGLLCLICRFGLIFLGCSIEDKKWDKKSFYRSFCSILHPLYHFPPILKKCMWRTLAVKIRTMCGTVFYPIYDSLYALEIFYHICREILCMIVYIYIFYTLTSLIIILLMWQVLVIIIVLKKR